MRSSEDQPAAGTLQGVGDLDLDGLTDHLPGSFDHQHRAVRHVGDPLALCFPGLDDLHGEPDSGQDGLPEGACDVIDVQDLDVLDPGDLGEPRIGGDDPVVLLLGGLDQLAVDEKLGGLEVLDPGVGIDALELTEHVEAVSTSFPLVAIGTVCQGLQFVDHVPLDHDGRVDRAGSGEVDHAPVDDRGSVHQQRHHALGSLLELDVGDHQAEIVLGRKDHRHRQVDQ